MKLTFSKDEIVSPEMFLQNFWSSLGKKKTFNFFKPISMTAELSGSSSSVEWS